MIQINIFLFAGAVEFPAIAVSILFLLKMGRRWPLSLTTAGAGLACLMTAVVKDGNCYYEIISSVK